MRTIAVLSGLLLVGATLPIGRQSLEHGPTACLLLLAALTLLLGVCVLTGYVVARRARIAAPGPPARGYEPLTHVHSEPRPEDAPARVTPALPALRGARPDSTRRLVPSPR